MDFRVALDDTMLYIKKFRKRNEKILNSSTRKTTKNIVNLHWWSRCMRDKVENVGDFLSTVVFDYMLKQKGICHDQVVNHTAHLYAIGSIIQGGAQNAVIWGSGLKHGVKDISPLVRLTRKLDVRLVRGPETRNALLGRGYKCPLKFGDPAILMPLIYQPKEMEKKDYLVVLHFKTQYDLPNAITPLTEDYQSFMDKIYNSKLVISSSLHGIILAEAYGIPAILLKDTETENMFKYNDYYHSTGRYDFPVTQTIEEALSIIPPSVPNFTEMRKDIMSSFPYDLWGK